MDRLTAYTDYAYPQTLPFSGPRPNDRQLAVLAAQRLLEGLPMTSPKSQALRGYVQSRLEGQDAQPSREPAAAPAALSVDGRLSCVMTLLSDMLWVNNNTPVIYRVFVGPRANGTDPAALWARTREEAPEAGDEPEFTRITPADLRTALMNAARLGLNDLGEDWNNEGEYPQLPDDHIARYLTDDLLDVLFERIRPTELHGTGFLPVRWDEDLEDEVGTVVLIGPDEVAVLDLDVMA
ncbi:hypothetical protein [Dactylosporangium sp. NPDC051541]|uniref:hypothetical protein n=1 Tax=Dactylosporangium sp. NPDC051541 TaxID=3363977 RepID=UPI003794F63A